MATRCVRWGLAVAGAVMLTMTAPGLAQNDVASARPAPDYSSGISAGGLSDFNFNTPESDGRPGVKFFAYGVEAFKNGDYLHAVDMYKVAASWAYKPAEYNLAVMYFKGQGILVDRPRGAAWMVLAAERGNPGYVKARDRMVTVLDKAEFQRTDEIWNQLKPKYGDAVALRRAKAQWGWARTHQIGTRVGGAVGELHVGAPHGFRNAPPPPGLEKASSRHSGMDVLGGGSVDGAIAYRQFQQSDNPYSPVFLKNRNGSVSVEPLQLVKPTADKPAQDASGNGSSPPPERPPQGA